MRGIAAIMVAIHHYSKSNSNLFLLLNANLAVDLFFILSGFVLAHSYATRIASGMTFGEYIRKRIIRLYPMFALGLLFGLTVLLTIGGADGCSSLALVANGLRNLLFLPSLNACSTTDFGSPTPAIGAIFTPNPPLWSLFFEMVASCGFFLLAKLSGKRLLQFAGMSFALLLALSVLDALATKSLGIQITHGWGTMNFIGGFPRVFYGFALGIYLYQFLQRDRGGIERRIPAPLSYPAVLFLLLTIMLAFPFPFRGLYSVVCVLTVCPALVLLGAAVTTENRFTLALSKVLGQLSYPVYCLHVPVGLVVFAVASKFDLPAATASALSLVGTIVVSAIFLKVYDEPVRRALANRMPKFRIAAETARRVELP